MSEVKKISVASPLTTLLALVWRGGQSLMKSPIPGAVQQSAKFKEHPTVSKIAGMADYLWTILGLVLILHGVQFKNLFLCTQVVMHFCYGRVSESICSLCSAVTTAAEKMGEDKDAPDETKADAKAEAKPDNKHAQKRAAKKDSEKSIDSAKQREDDAAETKKMLAVLDSGKVTGLFRELCVAAVGCHMVMQGGLARAAVIAHALVKASKEKVHSFLDFSGHEDMQVWADLLLNWILYAFFGGMAIVFAPLALALDVAMCGAQLVTKHGLRIAKGMGKIPDAEAFAGSINGLAVLGGLTAFGTLWQFWAAVADSGMAWYFKMIYLPAYVAENIVSLF